MAYGRPMKGTTRRIPITVHTTTGTLDAIDKYVTDRRQEEARVYSRSDFWNEAAESLLRNLGRLPEDPENTGQICSENEKKTIFLKK